MNSVPLPEFSEESQEQRQFAFQLLRLIKNEKTYQLSYNPEEVVNTLGGLKKELAKTAFEYEKLNEHNRKKIDEITQSKSKAKTFLQLLQNENNSLIMEPIPKVENESKISTGWMGKRLTIEIPVLGEKGLQKHLAPELLNQDFMWSSDYYHYEDWKTILKHYYDNLSLLIVEPNHNFVYSEMRLARGIFPDPERHRTPDRLPLADNYQEKPLDMEKDPSQYFVRKELRKEKWKTPVPTDVGMIVNLLNIKQCLKQNYPVTELVHKILSFDFIERLMEEQLSNNEDMQSVKPLTVQRNAGK